jgi:hypothetical protein
MSKGYLMCFMVCYRTVYRKVDTSFYELLHFKRSHKHLPEGEPPLPGELSLYWG